MKVMFEYGSKKSPLKKPTQSLQLVPTVFYLVTFTYMVFMVKKSGESGLDAYQVWFIEQIQNVS